MNSWIIILIASINCIVTCTYAEDALQKEEPMPNYREQLANGTWMPFKMVFPDHYVVLPMIPGEDVSLSPGFCCGEKEAIENLWEHSKKNPESCPNPPSGVFVISWSDNVAQTGPKSFSESSDVEFNQNLKKVGGMLLNMGMLDWNGFPVQFIEAKIPPVNVFLAYIGLNSGGMSLFVRYIAPINPSDKDWAVWKQFLQKSSGVPVDEFLKLHNQE